MKINDEIYKFLNWNQFESSIFLICVVVVVHRHSRGYQIIVWSTNIHDLIFYFPFFFLLFLLFFFFNKLHLEHNDLVVISLKISYYYYFSSLIDLIRFSWSFFFLFLILFLFIYLLFHFFFFNFEYIFDVRNSLL